MTRILHSILLILLVKLTLYSEQIQTFYGPLDIEEPVLIELIQSPAFQRLKSIHQYGVAYYTTHSEEYNRFDHSLGVFAILKLKGASLEEQIAGLLHDVSHTVFSHVGDWVFKKEYQQDDYQSIIHRLFLVTSGLESILNKYGYAIEQILPKREDFNMLEQPLPNLCADRIDYNIQGAYFQNFLTKEEAQEFFQDLKFEQGHWITTKIDLATKLARFSLFMTENCWGSDVNYVTSQWLASAILQGINTNLISWHEFHFGTDEEVYQKLITSQDPIIINLMSRLANPKSYYELADKEKADVMVKFKCRGIDPWIMHEENIVRLSSIVSEIAGALKKTKEKAQEGWPIRYTRSNSVRMDAIELERVYTKN